MDAAAIAELTAALGADRVSVAAEDLVAYAYDGSWMDSRPDLVVHPQTTGQIAAVLRIAEARRIPVVPRGAGTGLAGGSLPAAGSICLNLARMNRILEISAADTMAVIQPGVVTNDIQRAVERIGL